MTRGSIASSCSPFEISPFANFWLLSSTAHADAFAPTCSQPASRRFSIAVRVSGGAVGRDEAGLLDLGDGLGLGHARRDLVGSLRAIVLDHLRVVRHRFINALRLF